MNPRFEPMRLSSRTDWHALISRFFSEHTDKIDTPALNTLSYLEKYLNVNAVLIEFDYVDRDHRAAYSLFYCRQFRSPPPLCHRLHFFTLSNSGQPLTYDRITADGVYAGYIVVRPIASAPIGRTVLAVSPKLGKNNVHITCKGRYNPHINDLEQTVQGVPFSEQDSIVMRCAETAMWTAARMMSKSFRHGLVLPDAISRMGTIGFSSGRILPSGGLTIDQMAHGFTMLGFSPIAWDQEAYDESDAFDPCSIAFPYLASGMPVVFGVPSHAITACGALGKADRRVKPTGKLMSTSAWADGLVIQDDSMGPYRLMPRTEKILAKMRKRSAVADLLIPPPTSSDPSDDWWQTAENVDSVIVPLPDRVYLTAAGVARFVKLYLGDDLPPVVHGIDYLCNNAYAAKLKEALVEGKHGGVVYSIRCRKSLDFRQDMKPPQSPKSLATVLRNTSLSRYVWVVELTTYDLFVKSQASDRLVLGEIVLDATAHDGARQDMVLFAHFLGVVGVLEDDATKQQRHVWYTIPDDVPVIRPGIPLWSD